MADKAGSVADSSSRSIVEIHVDITLVVSSFQADFGRTYEVNVSRSVSKEISSLYCASILPLSLSSN